MNKTEFHKDILKINDIEALVEKITQKIEGRCIRKASKIWRCHWLKWRN